MFDMDTFDFVNDLEVLLSKRGWTPAEDGPGVGSLKAYVNGPRRVEWNTWMARSTHKADSRSLTITPTPDGIKSLLTHIRAPSKAIHGNKIRSRKARAAEYKRQLLKREMEEAIELLLEFAPRLPQLAYQLSGRFYRDLMQSKRDLLGELNAAGVHLPGAPALYRPGQGIPNLARIFYRYRDDLEDYGILSLKDATTAARDFVHEIINQIDNQPLSTLVKEHCARLYASKVQRENAGRTKNG